MLSRFARLAAFIGHARARYLLLIGGGLLGLMLATVAVWTAVHLRQGEIISQQRDLQNLASILADETDRGFQAAEIVQTGVIRHIRELHIDSPEEFDRQVVSAEMNQNLKDRIAGLAAIDVLSLENLRGIMINTTSRSWPMQPVDLSDREFFRLLPDDSSRISLVGEPVLNRYDGQWVIMFTRKISTPDGRLLGFVNTPIRLAFFEQQFSRIKLGEDAAFAIYRLDGTLMARYPHVDRMVGKPFADTVNFHRILASLDGAVRLNSQFDGKDRVVTPHLVEHFPLIVAVSETTESILANWHAMARVLAGTTILLELVIAATVLLAVRHLYGYEQLQAAETARAQAEGELAVAKEHEQAMQALRTQEHRFNTALHNMIQGLLLISHAGRLLVVNRRLFDLFEMPVGSLVPDMTYEELTERVVALGNVSVEDMRNARDRRAELIKYRERAAITWELSDGRAFNVTHQPMEEGWLTTFEDITDRRETEARMAHLAHHDALTDLPNRVLFRQKLEDALAHARRGSSLALLCLDLDQFKAVNDTLGHPIGDALLCAAAERLARNTRDTDMVARLGGDEFAIVVAPIEKPAEATRFADRLIELIAAPFDIAGHQIVIGTSIGIAFAPQDSMNADQLLRGADLALYRAKTDGRGVCRLFHAEMDAQMQARRLLELDLRQALLASQFELFYQPLVDLRAGAATGFEALLRWRHPERGIVSPADFIPLAEEIGLIMPLGEWALREACKTAASWPGTIRVAVNLSPAQFKSRNLVTAVAQALHEAQLAPGRLELEITETVILQDTAATVATLHQLHALGVGIAMDDFGTGYSSLSYLRRFPFDRIKIDQSFVRELCSKQDCGAIVRAIAGLSRDLGMATTAEGVETSEQLSMLRDLGCTEVQGYLFSPAVPSGDVAGLLDTIAETLRPPVDAVLEPVA